MTDIKRESDDQQQAEKVSLGFWLYLMTDCILFGSLFATYVVLRNSTFGGPSGHELFNMPFVLAETLILLTSSFVTGLAYIAAQYKKRRQVIFWLVMTFLLGAAFLFLELREFSQLAAEGNSWQRSGFLSAFFTLVGTHGAHITVGLLWLTVLLVRLFKSPIGSRQLKQITLFSMFWHFLDLIWIFIFSIVYLMGVA